MMIYVFKIRNSYFDVNHKLKISKEYFFRIFKLGLPLAQTTLIEVTSWTIFVSWIGRLGTASLASHEIALKIKDFLLIPGHAIGSVTTSLISENLARKSEVEAKENSLASIKILMSLMGGIGIILFIFSNQLVALFIDNPQIISKSSTLLKIMALYQIVDAIFIISRASLVAAEDVKFVRKVFLLGGWGFMLPLVYMMINILNWNVNGAWIGFTIFIALCATIFSIRFFRTKWSSTPQQSGAEQGSSN
jgi:Na+-driven multidrug efflux pump